MLLCLLKKIVEVVLCTIQYTIQTKIDITVLICGTTAVYIGFRAHMDQIYFDVPMRKSIIFVVLTDQTDLANHHHCCCC